MPDWNGIRSIYTYNTEFTSNLSFLPPPLKYFSKLLPKHTSQYNCSGQNVGSNNVHGSFFSLSCLYNRVTASAAQNCNDKQHRPKLCLDHKLSIISSHLISSHLISSHLISSRLISSHLV